MFLAMLLAAQVAVAPTQDFWARFSAPPPGVSATSPMFVEFGARIDITDPVPGKPLDLRAVEGGLCRYGAPCSFRLNVLLLLADHEGLAVPVGVRYVMENGTVRDEGFASAVAVGSPFTYWRRVNGAWVALSPGTQAVREEMFVSATAKYVAAQ